MRKYMDFELNEMCLEIKNLARKVCEEKLKPQVRLLDEKKKFPAEFIKEFGSLNFFGVNIPEEYGGLGLGVTALVAAIEEVARVCPGTSVVYGANALGTLPILLFGTEDQKKKYLTKIASGEFLAAFALTEADSGSDALAMKTKAIKSGDYYLLNGSKQFISNGGRANVYSIFAVTNPKRGLLGISGFILEKGTKGLSFGKSEKKVGLHCSDTRSLNLTDCKIPAGNLIGGKEGLGSMEILHTLNNSRIVVGGQCVGIAEGAFEAALHYSKKRKQFGKSISSFQAIQHKLADMAKDIEAARLLVYKAAWYADNKANKHVVAKFGAMAKLFASEVAARVTDEAVQIFGGMGIMEETGIAKFWRDARATRIYEGTSEIQRNEIAQILIKESSNK